MKKITLLSAIAALILASCAGNPEGQKAATSDAVELTDAAEGTTFSVDAEASKVVWTGTKVTGEHFGTVDIKSGSVIVNEGAIVGGEFVIDMNSISADDLEGEYKEKLDGHLKSDDFFSAGSYPEAKFTITEVSPSETAGQVTISGNLEIKGISKNISFEATTEQATENSITTKANFNIARADWNVSYEGKPDDLISKEINFDITLVANQE